MSKLSDSYVYEILGLNNTVNTIATKINKDLDSYRIPSDQLQSILNDFKFKINNYGKEKIIAAIQNGTIIFVDAPGINLPSWCIQDDRGRIVAICNLFGKIDVTKPGRYQVKEIFGLAVVAFITRIYFDSENKIKYNSTITLTAGAIYTRMVVSLLDSLFSISSEIGQIRYSAITYCVAKFYYRRVAEKKASLDQEMGNIMPIVKTVIPNTASTVIIDEISKTIPDEAFDSLPAFIKALSTNFPQLANLEINLFLRKMITNYGEKSILMLENMPYLLSYSCSSLYSTNLIKDYRFSMFLGKEGPKLVTAIFSLAE